MSTYTPRPDGLPALVIAFFRSNPDEELNLDDITAKFDCTRGNIHTLLAEPVKHGLLARQQKEGEWLYKRGTALQLDRPAKATKTDKPAKVRAPQVAAPIIALEKVTIEKGIPIPSLRGSYKTDFVPLLKQLQVGESFALPIACHSSISSAICTAHKGKAGVFTKRSFKESDQVRVWRVA